MPRGVVSKQYRKARGQVNGRIRSSNPQRYQKPFQERRVEAVRGDSDRWIQDRQRLKDAYSYTTATPDTNLLPYRFACDSTTTGYELG